MSHDERKTMIIEVPYFKYANNYKLWTFQNRKVLDQYDIKLKVYDGIPGSPWNGGRMPLDIEPDEKVDTSFALTNQTIDDFDHAKSHEYLKRFHKPGNTIIISNMELLDHLKSLYPEYKFIYSITAYRIDQGFDGYDEIEKKCDYIVPRNEIIDQTEEFYKRNTKQYILLYSYECSYCPLYVDHYKVIGEIIKDKDQAREHLFKCWFKDRKLLKEVGLDENVYSDYTYMTAKKFHHKLLAIDPKILAGYKVGRNSQSWEKVVEELSEIMELITKK